jgi:hypothetical protein
MRPDRRYRLLEYATLALACICLLVAEVPFFPGADWGILPVIFFLTVAWWVEGRWVLPNWGANVVALVVLAGAGLWLNRLWADPDSWIHIAPMPAGIVPALGPLLPALLIIRVFRPREPVDFWLLQGMGLLQVGLACVLANGPEIGGLLVAYLACAMGCLLEHYLATGRVGAGGPEGSKTAWGWRSWRLGPFLASWTVLTGGVAVGLFLVTPRLKVPDWDPMSSFGNMGRGRPSASGSIEGIDLTTTGWVQLGGDPAFLVQANDEAGRPVTNLPTDQRWRGAILDTYRAGVWGHRIIMQPAVFGGGPSPGLPDLGPGSYFLTFTVRPYEAGGLFLAEPLHLKGLGSQLPVEVIEPRNYPVPLFRERAMTLLPSPPPKPKPTTEFVYQQVMPPRDAFGNPAGRNPLGALHGGYLELMLSNPLPQLVPWTEDLLRRLEQDPRYGLKGVRQEDVGPVILVKPDHWATVARALSNYLSSGGAYTHTLEQRRQDEALDPVLDFLFNLKKGHCERFAAALTLMLRSVGIPARIVKGYHGLEHQGDGLYVVRQSQIHAWVEALVPAREDPEKFDWLTLDPTPDAGSSSGPPFSFVQLWKQSQKSGEFFWKELIVGYDSANQADLMARLRAGELLRDWRTFLVLGALAAVGGVAWWLWRPARTAAGAGQAVAVAFYARLLGLLAGAGLRPARGQTPREFAASAAAALGGHHVTADWADVPREATELYYRVRFGGRPLEGPEADSVAARIDAFAHALRGAPRLAGG